MIVEVARRPKPPAVATTENLHTQHLLRVSAMSLATDNVLDISDDNDDVAPLPARCLMYRRPRGRDDGQVGGGKWRKRKMEKVISSSEKAKTWANQRRLCSIRCPSARPHRYPAAPSLITMSMSLPTPSRRPTPTLLLPTVPSCLCSDNSPLQF